MKVVCGFKSRDHTTSFDQEEEELKLNVDLDSTDEAVLVLFDKEARMIARSYRTTKKSLSTNPFCSRLKKKC